MRSPSGATRPTDIATQVGCELNDDGTVAVADSMETTVDGVYAVGDVTPGHNQIPVAMGKGAQAGLDIHYDLRDFPRDLDSVREHGPVGDDEVPGIGERVHAAAADYEEARAPPIESPTAEPADDD